MPERAVAVILASVAEIDQKASKADTEAKRTPDHPVGLWGRFQALRDPDVQLAVGAGLHFARRYGQTHAAVR